MDLPAVIEVVQGVMEDYSIPIEVWLPIMMHESGGNPGAHNSAGEDSRGLFQINMGSPGTDLNISRTARYGSLNLFDPAVNAKVAAEDFLRGAYSAGQQRGLSGADLTAYVWQKGIRPYWTASKETSIKTATNTLISTGKYGEYDISGISGSSGGSSPGSSKNFNNTSSGSSPGSGSWTENIGDWFKSGFYGLIGVVLLVAGMFLIFKDESNEGGSAADASKTD